MNMTYMYLRKHMGKKAYFRMLAQKNENIIKKYTGIKYVAGIYKVECVNKLPLKCKVSCRFDNPQHMANFYRDREYDEPNYKCMMCWQNVLEDVNKKIDVLTTAPGFLKGNNKSKRKPVSFL